jgi:hypothetical protein
MEQKPVCYIDKQFTKNLRYGYKKLITYCNINIYIDF